MQIGDIVYLYIIDLVSVLAVKQELIPNRFCKITDITPVKGGTKEHQYFSIEELETAIDNLKEDLVEEKYEDMKYLIKKIKETTK